MAQTSYSSIGANQSGSQYRTQDNDRYAAALTLHSGSSRPAYAVAGTLWVSTAATPWVLNMYDGTDDIPLGTVNATTNIFTPANALVSSSLVAMSAAINEAAATVASASTTDIGAAAGNYLSVTGTTTITALGTIQAGTRRIARFASSLTLTHNATSLILPGGANIVTAAGDVAEFISMGSGNWFCASYERATALPAYPDQSGAWTAPQRPSAKQTTTIGGSVTIDLTTYQDFDLTLSSGLTLANPTLTAVVGQRGVISITPAAFGVSAMGTYWKRVGATGAPSTITGIGRIDYHVRSATRIEYTYNDVEA